MARPPQTESISTPSCRATVRTVVPEDTRPCLPDGVNTIFTSVWEDTGFPNFSSDMAAPEIMLSRHFGDGVFVAAPAHPRQQELVHETV